MSVYEDIDIRITRCSDNIEEDEKIVEYFKCVWINDKGTINESYMVSKTSEYIANNYPGAWPTEKGVPIRGMRGYYLDWDVENEILYVRWA